MHANPGKHNGEWRVLARSIRLSIASDLYPGRCGKETSFVYLNRAGRFEMLAHIAGKTGHVEKTKMLKEKAAGALAELRKLHAGKRPLLEENFM